MLETSAEFRQELLGFAYSSDELDALPEKLKKLETPQEKEKLLENEYPLAYVYLLHISGRKDKLANLGVTKYTWEIMVQNQKLNELLKKGTLIKN